MDRGEDDSGLSVGQLQRQGFGGVNENGGSADYYGRFRRTRDTVGGRILAYAGMLENKNVSWLPSYGPEMRGGTANCNVIISDDVIGSPILNSATTLIVMNGPSLDKFESYVESGGIIIKDSSLVQREPARTDVKVTVFLPPRQLLKWEIPLLPI